MVGDVRAERDDLSVAFCDHWSGACCVKCWHRQVNLRIAVSRPQRRVRSVDEPFVAYDVLAVEAAIAVFDRLGYRKVCGFSAFPVYGITAARLSVRSVWMLRSRSCSSR